MPIRTISPEELAKAAPCKRCKGDGGFFDYDAQGDPTFQICPRCKGSKHERLIEASACIRCKGDGEITVFVWNGDQSKPQTHVFNKAVQIPCPRCQGSKHEPPVCQNCFGTGIIERAEGLAIYDDECPICKGEGYAAIDALAPAPASEKQEAKALQTANEIMDAIQESLDGDYDARTLALWVAGLTNTLLGQLGGQALSPDQFDAMFARKEK